MAVVALKNPNDQSGTEMKKALEAGMRSWTAEESVGTRSAMLAKTSWCSFSLPARIVNEEYLETNNKGQVL